MTNVVHKSFKSVNGKNRIHSMIWYPDKDKYEKPVAILQISHGMMDHISRYNEMAEYMTQRGILVVGHDHLGHGESVQSNDELGYFTKKNSSRCLVGDVYKLTCIMKKKYPTVPYILLGHSMGSFIVRRYISTYTNAVDAVILMGTGNQPVLLTYLARVVSGIINVVRGSHYRSEYLEKLIFGKYNDRVISAKTQRDWVTTDEKKLEDYNNDEKCSFIFTANGYIGLFDTVLYTSNINNIKKIPHDLPIFMASGAEDPVGGYGRHVEKLFHIYEKYLDDVELRLYKECRHELHTDVIRQDVFLDIYNWIKEKVL